MITNENIYLHFYILSFIDYNYIDFLKAYVGFFLTLFFNASSNEIGCIL